MCLVFSGLELKGIYLCAFEEGEEFEFKAAHAYVCAISYDTNIPFYLYCTAQTLQFTPLTKYSLKIIHVERKT